METNNIISNNHEQRIFNNYSSQPIAYDRLIINKVDNQ